MTNFSIFIEDRAEYRRMLRIFKKTPRLAEVMTHWEARHIHISCRTEGDATLLAAALKASFEKEGIAYEIKL